MVLADVGTVECILITGDVFTNVVDSDVLDGAVEWVAASDVLSEVEIPVVTIWVVLSVSGLIVDARVVATGAVVALLPINELYLLILYCYLK